MKILYLDNDIVVCLKMAGQLSTDEAGGVPDAIRDEIGIANAEIHTVHRLDRTVGGLMVYARNAASAANLGRQIADKSFIKEYLAIVNGKPQVESGRFDDLLFRDKEKNVTYVVKRQRKGVRDASLEYNVIGTTPELSLVRIRLLTGRTHQIRAQFSSRKMPLFGDRKYGARNGNDIALWSCFLSFTHPTTGKAIQFEELPPADSPWTLFDGFTSKKTDFTSAKRCQYAKDCGACSYIGQTNEAQLKKKQAKLEKYLQSYGNVLPIIGMSNPYNYRSKVQSAFGIDANGNSTYGIYKQGSHRIVQVDNCLIEDEICSEIINYIFTSLPRFKISVYDENSGKGFLRHVQIRRSTSTGEIMIIAVAASYSFKAQKPFVADLVEHFPDIRSIYLNINDRFTPVVLGDRYKLLYGKDYIEDELLGFRFRLSPGAFYQVNSRQTEILYKTAVDFASLTGKENVLDAYCGTGTIGICASTNAASVTGIEINKASVKDAIYNAKRNNITNCSFITGDASEFMEECVELGRCFDTVFMDPPRGGSDESFLNALIKLSPNKIIYVSCNPETLSRDLELLEPKYKIKLIQGIDMFPFTEHVETVVLMSRKAD